MREIRRAAIGFAACFPSLRLDMDRLNQALQVAARTTGTPTSQFGAMVIQMLDAPPVDDLLLPFLHTVLVPGLIVSGSSREEAEIEAGRVVTQLAEEMPMAGLTISIAAPRSGLDVGMLQRHDQLIKHLHHELTAAGARSVGPQEHGADGESDHVPSSQWRGHVSADCEPRVDHDILVALSGPSVGVGESMQIARCLRIPVLSVVMAPRQALGESPRARPSCRSRADGDIVIEAVSGVHDASIPASVLAELTTLAPAARVAQRHRYRAISKLHPYRMHLAQADTMSNAPAGARSRVLDPLRFAALSTVERDDIARQLQSLTQEEHAIWSALTSPVRATFSSWARTVPVSERGEVLRTAQREMLMTSGDSRVQRHRDWTDPAVWDRIYRVGQVRS